MHFLHHFTESNNVEYENFYISGDVSTDVVSCAFYIEYRNFYISGDVGTDVVSCAFYIVLQKDIVAPVLFLAGTNSVMVVLPADL